MENEPQIQPESPSEPFDKEWFEAFKNAGGALEAFDYLEGEKPVREEQKTKFEAGEIENPILDYPKLNVQDLENRDTELSNLKQQIVSEKFQPEEKMEIVQQVYRWKINEKLAEVRMLKAAANGDMRRFQRYSEFVYGKPSPEIFAYTSQSIKNILKTYAQSPNQALQKAAQELDTLLISPEGAEKIALPDQEVFAVAREKTIAELGSLIMLPESTGEFASGDIKTAFETAISQAKIDGWKVVVKANAANVSVSQERKEVNVPEKKSVTRDRIAELIIHEIGTHALRRSNGERTKLMLLGLGLDRNRDDEGVTGLREQILDEKIEDFSGLEGHLAISLANGLDGTKRNFRQVYEVMQKYFYIQNLAEGKTEDLAKKNSQTKAWARSVRTFRGTNCQTPGVSFNKDILYREANIDVWEVVRQNPSEMSRFSVGKYDPSNPRHIMILDQLGITDEDLQKLD